MELTNANPVTPNAGDAARRPLKSRGTWWAAWLSTRLVRWNVSPNAISIYSMGFAAIAAGAFAGTRYVDRPIGEAMLFVLAIFGIQGRLLCNMMDGMVAVEGGKRTPSGELFNEVPDRVADTLILVAAGYAGDPKWGPTLGWLAALLAMFTAYVRAVGKAAGAGTHFVGPMAKPQRMAGLSAICLCCVAMATALAWRGRRTLSYGVNGYGIALGVILGAICLGCIWTIYNRLVLIVADLRAKDR